MIFSVGTLVATILSIHRGNVKILLEVGLATDCFLTGRPTVNKMFLQALTSAHLLFSTCTNSEGSVLLVGVHWDSNEHSVVLTVDCL